VSIDGFISEPVGNAGVTKGTFGIGQALCEVKFQAFALDGTFTTLADGNGSCTNVVGGTVKARQ
jgi:hypothetical protein